MKRQPKSLWGQLGAPILATLALGLCARPAHAVQASASNPIFPDAPDATLDINEEFNVIVAITNTSTNTPPPTTAVPATLHGTTRTKLACQDAPCVTELPGTLTMTPQGRRIVSAAACCRRR